MWMRKKEKVEDARLEGKGVAMAASSGKERESGSSRSASRLP